MSIWFSSQMPLCSVIILVRPTCTVRWQCGGGRSTLSLCAITWAAVGTGEDKVLCSKQGRGREQTRQCLQTLQEAGLHLIQLTRMMSMMSGTQVESAGDVMR